MNDLLKAYPVIIEFPIAWGDMDAFQHVNNVVYFKYFESARIAYFERMDMMEFMKVEGIGPILASTRCRFKIPLTYPDTVSVGSRISQVDADRFIMEYCVVSNTLNKVAAEGDGQIVSFNYHTNSKAPLPEELKRRIAEIETSA